MPCVSIDDLDDIPDNAKRSARRLFDALARTRAVFETGRNLHESARKLFEDVGLKDALLVPDDPQGARRWENIQFLLRSIERFEGRQGDGRPSLAQFLARITLRKDDGAEEEAASPTRSRSPPCTGRRASSSTRCF